VAEPSGETPSQDHASGFSVPRFRSSNDLLYSEIERDERGSFTYQGAGMQHMTQDDLQSGKKSALYTDFAPTLQVYLCELVPNTQDAEDLLLEVFLAAFNSDLVLALPAQQQLAWLRRVARNKAVDRYRHVARLALVPLEHARETADEDLTPQQLVERRQAYERLLHVMGQLPLVQQELLRLRYGHDLPLTQIAKQFGKSEGTVRKLLSRTLRGLRKRYEQSERGE
jgi:RNA polymerase sigma factor (sigma-70 family)